MHFCSFCNEERVQLLIKCVLCITAARGGEGRSAGVGAVGGVVGEEEVALGVTAVGGVGAAFRSDTKL